MTPSRTPLEAQQKLAKAERLVVGCMTGTSVDGLDASLVRVRGQGLAMRAECVRHVAATLDRRDVEGSEPSTPELASLSDGLRRLASQEAMNAREIAALQRAFALRHAEVIAALLREDRCDLVCVHGQTVYHEPPLSWQLMQPSPIARAVGAPVVFDLRQADLAVGGQGAPITPIADWVLLRDHDARESRVVVNLGGFCNATELPLGGGVDDVRAGDVCVCNRLLDVIARRRLGRAFDAGGAAALAGRANESAGRQLDALLRAQLDAKRSLGTNDELGRWIDSSAEELTPQDQLATACEAIGRAIGLALARWDGAKAPATRNRAPQRVLLAGGGVRNLALVRAIERFACSPGSSRLLGTTDEIGTPAQFREAVGFAVLGALCADGVPICLSGVTGACDRVLSGAWVYP